MVLQAGRNGVRRGRKFLTRFAQKGKRFDRELGSFVQSFGSKQLDASLVLIPSVGFLPVTDPRVTGTIAAIERRLLRDGFVMRYDTQATDDGLPPGEGAFLACSF